MLIAWFIPQGVLVLVWVFNAPPESPRDISMLALFLGVPALVALVVSVMVHPVLIALDRTRIRHYLLGYLVALHPLLLHELFLGSINVMGFQGLAFSFPVVLILPLPFIFWWLHYRVLRRLHF